MRWFSIVLALTLTCSVASAQGSKQQRSGKDLYEQALNALTGSNADKDLLRATDLMRAAAQAGYAPAQTVLGYWLENGEFLTAAPTEAADWYHRAAVQGDRLGEYAYGRVNALGIGVPRDGSAAQPWLQRAANKGEPFAAYYLGYVLDSTDQKAATEWFHKAAEQGIPQAYAKYGSALEQGRGVARDPASAYMWLLMAEFAGLNYVEPKLSILSSELGSPKVDELKKTARDRFDSLRSKRLATGCAGWDGELDDPPTFPPRLIQRYCR